MKVLLCIALAIVAVSATEKEEAAEDFKTRCLFLGSALGALTSLFGNNNQQVSYPVYNEEPVYWYYPAPNNQEIIYEYYPTQEYFYYYPSYQYDIYSQPSTGNYYYNSIGDNGRMQKQQISENTYQEYARRNRVIVARQAERRVVDDRIPPRPIQQEDTYQRETEVEQRPVQSRPVMYDSVYDVRPVQSQPNTEFDQRPVQSRPVMYDSVYDVRPVQSQQNTEFDQRPVQGRPVMYDSVYDVRPVQSRPVMYETVRPVQARPVQVVAVQQKTSPLQSLLGLNRPQQVVMQPAGQQVQYIRSKN